MSPGRTNIEMARPERFELPTFWFVAKLLNAATDIAYESNASLILLLNWTETGRKNWGTNCLEIRGTFRDYINTEYAEPGGRTVTRTKMP